MPAAFRLIVLGLFLFATRADAFLILSPDDICAPDEDPCVIDQPLLSSFALPLDFGLRTVRVTGDGSLRGNLDILCGAFESDVAGLLVDIERPPLDSWFGVRITARRACSDDEAAACLVDADCETLGAGTCSGGDGGIRASGDMVGGYVAIELVGAGDVALKGTIRASAPAAQGGGGAVRIESTGGSVDVAASIDASLDEKETTNYYDVYAGYVRIRAAGDLRLRRILRVNGHYGEVDLTAGGDLVVRSSILGRGGPSGFYGGASVSASAGGDMRIERGPGRRRLRIDLRGGGDLVFTAHRGGDGTFFSRGSLTVGEGVRLNANSGRGGYTDDIPDAGNWFLGADGDLRFDGKLQAKGRGYVATAGAVALVSDGSVRVGPRASLNLRSTYSGGSLQVEAGDLASVEVDGRLRLDAMRIADLSVYDHPGSGGDVEIHGGDVRFGGSAKTGGQDSNGAFYVRACRVHLEPDARVVARTRWLDAGSWSGISLIASGSLLAEAGSEIVGLPDSPSKIYYGDALDPPRLLGTISPEPELMKVAPSTVCPVCGDGERELWEACDDGNRESGDGCDVRCELEDN